jgi:hypothetical protein
VPLDRSAQAEPAPPAEIAVTPLRPETATGVVEQATSPPNNGFVLAQVSGPVVVPLPSSPELFSPQHSTMPPERSAQAKSPPAEMAVTVRHPPATHPFEHFVPHPPQLFESVCSFTHAPLHPLSPLGHAQFPLWQLAPVGHVVPHPPQWFVSVCGSTHCPPHVSVQAHVPFRQTYPVPFVAAHDWSAAGSLSTTPSQSLSLPSQVWFNGVHWHTLLDCPSSAAQVQPGTQSAAEVHFVVHTLTLPTGWQMPLGQAEFSLHGVPVPFVGAFWHEPPRQLNEPAHVEPVQQGWLSPPHVEPASVPESVVAEPPPDEPLASLPTDLLSDPLSLPAPAPLELEQAGEKAAPSTSAPIPPDIHLIEPPSSRPTSLRAAHVPRLAVGARLAARIAAPTSCVAALARRALRVGRARTIR